MFFTSYPFGFPSRSKCLPLDIIKFLVTKMRNPDKKVSVIRVDEDVALARSYEIIRIYHNMNIIVQAIGGDASLLKGKIKIPNMILANVSASTGIWQAW